MMASGGCNLKFIFHVNVLGLGLVEKEKNGIR